MRKRNLRIIGDETDTVGDKWDYERLLLLMEDPEICKGIFRQLEVLADVREQEVKALYQNKASKINCLSDRPENENNLLRQKIINAAEDISSPTFIKFQQTIFECDWYRRMLLVDFVTKIEPFLDNLSIPTG